MKLIKTDVPNNIKKILNNKTTALIENIGIPSRIAPLGGIDYEPKLFLINSEYLVLAENKWSYSVHYLVLELNTNYIFHQWNFDGESNLVFVNSSYEKLLAANFLYFNVVRKLISSESLGAYYDNSPEGGNFEKYANVLEMLIKDIDEQATKEGTWSFLIEEMQLGVI